MWFRLFLLMKKEFLQFSRNIPLLIIVLYSSTLDIYSTSETSRDIHNYPLAIYDRDKTTQSREIIQKLRAPFFRITGQIHKEEDIQKLIEEGTASAVVVFPQDFGKKIASYQPASVQVIIDGSNSNASELALRALSSIVMLHTIDLIINKWQISNVHAQLVPDIQCCTRYYYNPQLTESWALCLQEFFTILTLLGILLTATAMVNEKQFGTIEQLMVTPLRTSEIMIAKIIPMIIVLCICAFISLFVILKAVIGAPIEGSILAFFFVTIIYAFAISGLGILISTLSNNLSETVLFSLLMLVPIMFLSGAWVPLESTPRWMQMLVMCSPLKHYLALGTGILLKGNPLWLMARDLFSLMGLGVLIFIGGLIRFRKTFR